MNEIFNLTKNHTIRADMTASQILWWANVLLNPFGLVLRSFRDKHFRLDEKIDIRSLIKRKNKIGKFYMDKDERLRQEKPQADLFLDGDTGRVLIQKKMLDNTYDTSPLDQIVEGYNWFKILSMRMLSITSAIGMPIN